MSHLRTQVQRLFHEMAELSPADRRQHCARSDISPTVLREVEELLAYDSGSTSLIQSIGTVAELALVRQEPTDLLCGAYRLRKLLGRGGMGTVYLGERADGEIVHQAAVKLLQPGADGPEFRQRFLAERQILATLAHPHIARLLDAGHRDDGQPYLVMEYIEGQSIDLYARELSIRQKVRLFLKVCGAVGYLHRNLVVHRDLKPSNILVTKDGEPRLLDFGIAKMIDLPEDATVTGMRMLTPDYASPEQMTGSGVTTLTDMYSMGAVLYRLLTDNSPHRPESGAADSVGSIIVNGKITRPSKLDPALKGDLELILLKALRKEPQERYATIQQFSEDLERFLTSRPILARKGDTWYHTRKFVRRHWLPVAALSIAFSGLAYGLWTAHHERGLAERRFAEVRQLASELFTIERGIEQVAGATEARELIVKTALQYLERLSKEAGGDLALKTEIAQAYAKVANIQGGYRSTNLGRPADARESLRKAEGFFREVFRARPNDPAALRQLLNAVELKSRIEYGQLNRKGVEQTVAELEPLAKRYEGIVPAKAEEWDFLGGIYQTMTLAARRLDRPADALEFGGRCVEFQRKAAGASDAARYQGNLSASLAAYGKVQRSQGDLEGALATMKEGLEIVERLARRYPRDNRAQINLAADYSDLAALYDEENGISFDDFAESARWWERALEANRKLLHADPRESQNRSNTATTAWHYANLLRYRDPARALALYDEAIRLLREMPVRSGSRDAQLGIMLAESTLPLRRLGRWAEARERLGEAKRMDEATKQLSPHSPGMPAEAIARAEGDWAMASGRPAEAAAIHEAWLKRLDFGAHNARTDLRSALMFAEHYDLLSRAWSKAGKAELASAAQANRRELLAYWRGKVPSHSTMVVKLTPPPA